MTIKKVPAGLRWKLKQMAAADRKGISEFIVAALTKLAFGKAK